MSSSIGQVREDSQQFVAGLDEKDFVSVIVFSGHGYARLVAGPTKCDADGKVQVSSIIRKEVHLLNVTVFSEPLELTLKTIKGLTGDVVHSAVLFTDGCAVPEKWGVRAEQEKAYQMARSLNDFGAFVSCLGYGVYYDAQFIRELMAAGGNTGVFRHISEIDDFAAAVAEIRNVFMQTVPVEIDLTFTPGKGSAGRVYRITPEIVAIGEKGHATTRGLYEGEATFFIELPDPGTQMTITGTIGKMTVNESVAMTALDAEDEHDYIRAVGAYAFLTGDLAAAEKMLRLTSDYGLAERAAGAFTHREQREVGDIFRRVFRDRSFIGAGLKPMGPNNNVLNVLRVLIEDAGNTIFIPAGAYKRSGVLTKDPNVVENPLGKKLKVVGYTSDETRLNFSATCLKDVQVRENGGNPVDRKVWRTYNVILDGNLHVPELQAVLSKGSFAKLQDAGVIGTKETWSDSKTYTINLRPLKVVSPVWANPQNFGLVNLLREEKELEAEQKALNARIKRLGVVSSRREDDNLYIERSAPVETQLEYYTAPCIEIRLMGYKAQSYDCSAMSVTEAVERVQAVRQRLRVVRFLARAITFAMEMTNSKVIPWDSGVATMRGRETKLEQAAQYGGQTLKRVTWTEQVACS